jgi:hypothetical protein
LDDVQFPRRATWVSRNRFKNDQGAWWLTIPVWKKGLGLQNLRQVRICPEGRWRHKHLESLKTAYGHAPYLGDHLAFLEEMFSAPFDKLIDLNLAIMRYLMGCLEISPKLVLLSELKVKARGTPLLVEACKALGASALVVQSPARKHLEADLFQDSGIEQRYCRYIPPIYPQPWGEFVPNLSTLDLVLNCGPKARDILMRRQRRRAGDAPELRA